MFYLDNARSVLQHIPYLVPNYNFKYFSGYTIIQLPDLIAHFCRLFRRNNKFKKEYTSKIKKKQVTYDHETEISQSKKSLRSCGYMACTKGLSRKITEERIARLESDLSTLMVIELQLKRQNQNNNNGSSPIPI